MAEAPDLSSDEFARLRGDLVARAKGMGLPPEDVADVVDDAVLKVLDERKPDAAIPFARRVGAALRDAQAEYYRRRRARPDVEPGAEPPEGECPSTAHEHAAFRETLREICAALDPEMVQYAVLSSAGHTERSIGEQLGWDPLRTERVRRRLARNGPAKLRPLFDLINHKEAS
jgi:DNA-directed RNA polymerase specialized sigma24 family protein